ncbi:hypothetical protein [Streptomyces sp. Tue6028]|uniref:hypothetical protein n=1 Tax=Streptomyces sp. Tue6028 TaxID=2036037 RepID=UPI003EB856E3
MTVTRVWPGSEQKPLPAPVAPRTTDTGHNGLIQPSDIPQARPVDAEPAAATVEATAAELVLTLQRRPRRHLEGAH